MSRRPALACRWLDLPWGRLAVWQGGDGPVVVALHGLGGSGRYWQALAGAVGSERTLVAPDLPGFGRSDRPDRPYDRRFHLAVLDRLVDDVAPGRPVALAGHSVGAVLAALWAAAHPGRVRALALAAAPFPGLRPLPQPVRWLRDRPPGVRRTVLFGAVRALWALTAPPVALARGLPPSSALDFARQSVQARAWTAWTTLADPGTPAALAGLQHLAETVPVLLLAGSDDRRAPPGDLERWQALLPHASRQVVPGAGHGAASGAAAAALARWVRSA